MQSEYIKSGVIQSKSIQSKSIQSKFGYHVTTYKKFNKYLENGFIKPPVRMWGNIIDAENFSIQTGRKIILRIPKDNVKVLDGHKGKAFFIDRYVSIKDLEL